MPKLSNACKKIIEEMTPKIKGYVYAIRGGGESYFGSTRNKLEYRFKVHISSFKSGRRGCASHILFEKYGMDACTLELLETIVENDTRTLKEVEYFYITNFPCVNIRIPILIPIKEYQKLRYKEQRDDRLIYQKEYNKLHKDTIKEYQKHYYRTIVKPRSLDVIITHEDMQQML